MIPILTLSEMREAERLSVAGGLSEYELVLSAGEAVFHSVKAMLEAGDEETFAGPGFAAAVEEEAPQGGDREEGLNGPKPPLVVFVCGKGHNGADGLAAALRCAQEGLGAAVYHVHAEKYSPETRRLREQLAATEVPVRVIRSAADLPVFEDADLVVDALLGSGLNRPTEGLLASLIHGINNGGRPVLSVDCPSGVAGDSAAIPGPSVRADATLCLGALKLSALFHPARAAYGKIEYSRIAFDEGLLAGQSSRLAMYTWDDALDHLPLKTWRTHKYSAGKVLVIAGSLGMHGAAALCANAALRSGAGLVRAALPAAVHRDAAAHLLEIIGTPVGDDGARRFAPGHVAELLPWIDWADAIVVGPGLGKHPETEGFLEALFPALRGKRVVVDGDALGMFRAGSAPTPDGLGNFVLTPHAGEFARMGGLAVGDPMELVENARPLAQSLGLSLVRKGPTTFCVHRSGDILLSASGNPGMATAGTGDVLAGIMGRLLAVRPPEEAMPLAVFLHGRAGDAARRDRGTAGMTASDLILYLPLAIKELEDALAADEEEDEEDV
jgi:NAD(P)H-hydrate epimerase